MQATALEIESVSKIVAKVNPNPTTTTTLILILTLTLTLTRMPTLVLALSLILTQAAQTLSFALEPITQNLTLTLVF